jgi:hypothetical protein
MYRSEISDRFEDYAEKKEKENIKFLKILSISLLI